MAQYLQEGNRMKVCLVIPLPFFFHMWCYTALVSTVETNKQSIVCARCESHTPVITTSDMTNMSKVLMSQPNIQNSQRTKD